MDTDKHRWRKASKFSVKLLLLTLAVFSAIAVFWWNKDKRQGPVELSFEGYKWEKSSSGGGYWMGKFKVKNNSPQAISFYSMSKQYPPIGIMKANSDIPINLAVGCGLAADWYSLLPGEEVLVEEMVGDVEILWQGEFKYVVGEITPQQVWNRNKVSKQAIPSSEIHENDWISVRSTTSWPVKIGPFTLAGK